MAPYEHSRRPVRLASALLLLTACGGAPTPAGNRAMPTGPEPVRPSAGGESGAGAAALELTLRTARGELLDLGDYRGQPVLVALLGSYDTMSQASLESLARLARNHPDVLVVGVLVQQGAELLVDAYAAGADVDFPITHEPAGTLLGGTSELGPIPTIPFFIALDVEGRIVAIADGYSTDRRLEDLLARAYAAAPVRPREPLPLLGRPR